MRTLIEFKNGRQKMINSKVAQVLAEKGHIKIVEAIADHEKIPEPAVIVDQEDASNTVSDGLDEMDRDQLLKFAEDLEIKIHGRTGDEKIREIIREHTK